ncbi:hypothetical protein ACFVUY_20040 [Kitasatospora sp. NPDC058063]
MDEETAGTVQALVDPDRPVHVLGSGIADPWGGAREDFDTAVSEIQDATRLFYAA